MGDLESCRFNFDSKVSGLLCEGDVGGLEDMLGVISESFLIITALQGRNPGVIPFCHPFHL